jgi:hypothetical protein
MIYVNINIRRPKWWDRYKSIKFWHGKTIFKNKFWEVEILKSDGLLRFEFELSTKQDHAGANLKLGLFGYEIDFILYDNRHWNYDKNSWENYD